MNEPMHDIHKGMVLGYLLRSQRSDYIEISIAKLSETLKITTTEINNALFTLVKEERINLTISRAMVQLKESAGGPRET